MLDTESTRRLPLSAGEQGGEQGLTPEQAAAAARLRYVNDDESGISRRKAGRGFTYTRPEGGRVEDVETLSRIRALAIPPAWTDVWICRDEIGHLQATGRDARGRKQYRYHQRFRDIRDSNKYDHLVDFARVLPLIRERVDRDLARRSLTRERVLAAVVRLLDKTLIRIGNAAYAEQNRSFGLTTLRRRHVEAATESIRFVFRGKSGKEWKLRLRDRRVTRVIRACQEIPGQRLFQYLDEEGQRHTVTSADVNAYLRDVSGADVSAKDFRTWAGTVLTVEALREAERFSSATKAKRSLRGAISQVAERLGNTVAICRQCYVHPTVIDLYLEGDFHDELDRARKEAERNPPDALEPQEAATLALLTARLRD